MNEYQREYKGYYIKGHKEYPSISVVVTAGQGGKIPDVLSGMYTSAGIAMSAIDKYLESKPQKEANDNQRKTVSQA